MTLSALSWSIDSVPTHIVGYHYNAIANGGFDQMRGEVPLAEWVAFPTPPGQGAIVQASQDNGRVAWYGRLSAAPQIIDGVARIAAQGEKVRAVKATNRRFYQSKDYSLFTERAADPFNAAVSDDKLYVRINPGRIVIREISSNVVLAGTEFQGVVAWVPNAGPISRIAFTVQKFGGNDANYDLRVYTGPGPSGGWTQRYSAAQGAGSASAIDVTTGAPASHDAVIIQLNRTAAGTRAGDPWGVGITGLRVNGLAVGDTFTGSQVISNIATALGYGTAGIQTTALNVLPLDFSSGAWADDMTYVALLEDAFWRVLENANCEYALWSNARLWNVYQDRGAMADLTPLEVFNQVTVHYLTAHGAPAQVTVIANPDPLAGTGITNTFEESLTDVQGDATLATALATALMARLQVQRYSGTIRVVETFDQNGGGPFDIRPGDRITVSDFGPSQSITLRVSETEVDEKDDAVLAHVEQPDEADRLTALARLHWHPKRHHRKKRHRPHHKRRHHRRHAA
jgi:hypothetical protein